MKRIVVDMAKKKENLFTLHTITQKCIADLEFILDEQRFLQDLLSTFFIDLCKVELLPDTRVLNQSLAESSKKCNLLILELQTHEKHLATLLESIHMKGEISYRESHKELITNFDQFVINNKSIKIRIFTIIKNIMKQHKQKLLLSHANSQEVNNSKE